MVSICLIIIRPLLNLFNDIIGTLSNFILYYFDK